MKLSCDHSGADEIGLGGHLSVVATAHEVADALRGDRNELRRNLQQMATRTVGLALHGQ